MQARLSSCEMICANLRCGCATPTQARTVVLSYQSCWTARAHGKSDLIRQIRRRLSQCRDSHRAAWHRPRGARTRSCFLGVIGTDVRRSDDSSTLLRSADPLTAMLTVPMQIGRERCGAGCRANSRHYSELSHGDRRWPALNGCLAESCRQ